MTTCYKSKAIIFRKNDINESDRIFSVFTEEFWRLEIFAKAIRKIHSKLRPGIDVPLLSEIEFVQGKNKKTLIDATRIENFINITKDPEKFKIAQKILNAANHLIKGEEKDVKIFNLFQDVLSNLNNPSIKSADSEILYYYFLWNKLALLGYHPEINKCNICGEKLNPYRIYFSNKSGGVICKKCLNHDMLPVKINSDVIKILRIILQKELKTILNLKIGIQSKKLLKSITDNYYIYSF